MNEVADICFALIPSIYVLGLKGSSFFLCCLHYYVYMSQSTHINSSYTPQVLLYPSRILDPGRTSMNGKTLNHEFCSHCNYIAGFELNTSSEVKRDPKISFKRSLIH